MTGTYFHDSENPMVVRRPFSNGTEGDAWMSKWCEYCAHDHGLHNGNGDQPMCELVGNAMFAIADEPLNVEAWVAEPDDGQFFLPSRMICLRFTPCHGDGCHGDPGAADRARRVADVQAYWRERDAPARPAAHQTVRRSVRRRMSCSMTIDAVRERRKTVTRRHVDTWTNLQPGDTLVLIEKGMGLPKGAKQVVITEAVVTDVRVEPLHLMTDSEYGWAEVAREGFEGMEPHEFAEFWIAGHGVKVSNQDDFMAVQVRRIEWRYLDDVS